MKDARLDAIEATIQAMARTYIDPQREIASLRAAIEEQRRDAEHTLATALAAIDNLKTMIEAVKASTDDLHERLSAFEQDDNLRLTKANIVRLMRKLGMA